MNTQIDSLVRTIITYLISWGGEMYREQFNSWTTLTLSLIITFAANEANSADQLSRCESPIGRVVSLQGRVELKRGPIAPWYVVANLDTPLCEGDMLRTAKRSRAAVVLAPETFVRLDQMAMLSLRPEGNGVNVEMFVDQVPEHDRSANACGAGYFITRLPRRFKVFTPFLNAAVEGTEFQIAMACDRAHLSVFEGKVLAEGRSLVPASVSLTEGQATSAAAGEGPREIQVLINPLDAVQWALHYPALESTLEIDSLPDCASLDSGERLNCMLSSAEALLGVGRVDEAKAHLDKVLSFAPLSADANSLLAIVELVKNDKTTALALARRAVIDSDQSSRAWLALSYAQQAHFDLESALVAAQRAASLSSNNAIAAARVAELLVALGDISAAERLLILSLKTSPEFSRLHSILGLLRLAKIEVAPAIEAFSKAINIDSADPLPRLGLGLALIRRGELANGREQIEIAVALDPKNALLRSYLGRAFYEENSADRDRLAQTQFTLSRKHDPRDPTPDLYSAVLAHSQGRTIEAQDFFRQSIAKNDNRAPYRSESDLEQDVASRLASQSRIYDELGFEALALRTSFESLLADPSSAAGHRDLADALMSRPRSEAARLSELLQALTWQPNFLSPIDPQFLDNQSFVLKGAGPARGGLNEYTPLFVSDGLGLKLGLLEGGNRTRGKQATAHAVLGPFSTAVGHLEYSTDGFRSGSGFDRVATNAFAQVQTSPASSLFWEIRSTDETQGDLSQSFLAAPFDIRLTKERTLMRVGGHHRFTPSLAVAAVISVQDAFDATQIPATDPPFFEQSASELGSELQTVFRARRLRLTAGTSHYRSRGTLTTFGFAQDFESNSQVQYAYAQMEPKDRRLTLDLGLSNAEIRDPFFSARLRQVNPKFGVVFKPTENLAFRGATFRNLRRSIVLDQSLEPTHVAGFNQLYADSLGTDSRTAGLGADATVLPGAHIGMEWTKRQLALPDVSTNPLEIYPWTQRDLRFYAYWTPFRVLALHAEYWNEHIVEHRLFAESFLNIETQRIPVSATWFTPAPGLSLKLTVTAVRQSGDFRTDNFSNDFAPGEANFYLTDVSSTWKLPRRAGFFTLEVRNLFDKRYHYQETDTFGPTLSRFNLARERLVFARLNIAF